MASLLRASCSVFTLAVCHRAQVVYSTLAVPIQLNWRASNLAFLLPRSGSIATVRPVIANVVPSRGAVL
jgi:hypothetical protein